MCHWPTAGLIWHRDPFLKDAIEVGHMVSNGAGLPAVGLGYRNNGRSVVIRRRSRCGGIELPDVGWWPR